METNTTIQRVPLALIYPNPKQPRKHFDPGQLRELADSIDASGLAQPIQVRPDGAGKFMIVCGERRWRAHVLLERSEIDAIVSELTDDQLADRAIIENLQRVDISPIEEAHAFQARLDRGITASELATRLGVSVKKIQIRVALLQLAPTKQERVQLTAFERRVEAALEVVQFGYHQNEVDVVRKVRLNHASVVVEQLHLLEKHLRAMRMALEASTASAGVTGAA